MSKSKQKGTAFETLVLGLIKHHYPLAKRAALEGALDISDFYIPGEHRFILEAKNVARMNLAGWHGEAVVEARNAGVPAGFVVHKRVGKGQPEDQWVTGTLGDFLELVAPLAPEV